MIASSAVHLLKRAVTYREDLIGPRGDQNLLLLAKTSIEKDRNDRVARERNDEYRISERALENLLNHSEGIAVVPEPVFSNDDETARAAAIDPLLSELDDSCSALTTETPGKTEVVSPPDQSLNPTASLIAPSDELTQLSAPAVRIRSVTDDVWAKMRSIALEHKIPYWKRPLSPIDLVIRNRRKELKAIRIAADIARSLLKAKLRREKDAERKQVKRAANLTSKRVAALIEATTDHRVDPFLIKLKGREQYYAEIRDASQSAKTAHGTKASPVRTAEIFEKLTGKSISVNHVNRALAVAKKLEMKGQPWYRWRVL